MQENENLQPQGTPLPQAIEQEFEAVAKQAKISSNPLKFWLVLLTLSFTISMVSGIYLVIAGGAPSKPTPIVTESKEDSSSFFKSAIKQDSIGLIKIRGVIEEGTESGFSTKAGASAIAKRIRAMADKKEIKGLLLDINSPGGTVASVQDIYDSILYFKSKGKPVVAMFRDVAASGGFYVAMAADKIIAQPGTITGSIGVIMQGANVEGLLQKIGVKIQPIKSGKHKDIGSPYRAMSDEEIALLQDMIDDTYQQFFAVVKNSRKNITEEDLKTYADGRVFTGSRAKALGLIDDLGGEEKAKEYLTQMTGIKDIKFVTPGLGGLMDFLTISAGADSKLGLGKIQEISSPRVSYLWTF